MLRSMCVSSMPTAQTTMSAEVDAGDDEPVRRLDAVERGDLRVAGLALLPAPVGLVAAEQQDEDDDRVRDT